MRQLVELQQHASEFTSLDAELIFVFREEQEGVVGLKKIRDGKKTTYTLALDLDKKSSKAYSPANRTFDNYVIDKSGVVRKSIAGTLTNRATAEELLKTLKEISAK